MAHCSATLPKNCDLMLFVRGVKESSLLQGEHVFYFYKAFYNTDFLKKLLQTLWCLNSKLTVAQDRAKKEETFRGTKTLLLSVK